MSAAPPAVIAIDGPAASGKSSTAALLARRLGWAHLDSGALYRALTLVAVDDDPAAARAMGNEPAWSAPRILARAEELPVRLVRVGDVFRPEVAGVDVGDAIRSERVTRHVSAVSALPAVRQWVNARQRRAAAEHPAGIVVDGRDIGTVVFPEAPLKVFLTAAPEERARRRLTQTGRAPDAASLTRESQRLAARDAADASRPVAPLVAAADAVVLDTTRLSLEAQVDAIVALARQRFPG
jgi:cytidylate kinase